jgi:NAD-dependent dihydropyrimidine dehydrogenase PreA subunit
MSRGCRYLEEVERMVEELYGGIPREKIPWSPCILKEKCTGCGVCVSFCHKGVYKEGPDGPVVVNPHNCVVGCTGCASQCPSEAIKFPTLVELREALARLRREYRA